MLRTAIAAMRTPANDQIKDASSLPVSAHDLQAEDSLRHVTRCRCQMQGPTASCAVALPAWLSMDSPRRSKLMPSSHNPTAPVALTLDPWVSWESHLL